jgi:hypothetical protein
MADDKYSVEKVVQVWHDGRGDRVEFRPHPDGLDDLYELRSVTADGASEASVTLNREQALLLFEAALKVLRDGI